MAEHFVAVADVCRPVTTSSDIIRYCTEVLAFMAASCLGKCTVPALLASGCRGPHPCAQLRERGQRAPSIFPTSRVALG
jgi:hypothetical protein